MLRMKDVVGDLVRMMIIACDGEEISVAIGEDETFLSGPLARPAGAEDLRPHVIQGPAG